MFCRWREALLVVQLARLSSSLVELPELYSAASAAGNAPSMAWAAILTASLAALFRQHQLGVILAALLIQLSPK
mgnify:CR=1 FL=1